MGAQFADDGALRGLFQRQGDEDALALVPFPGDIVLANLPGRLQDGVSVAAGMVEAGEGGTDLIAEVLVGVLSPNPRN
jgi:hypothetical protein